MAGRTQRLGGDPRARASAVGQPQADDESIVLALAHPYDRPAVGERNVRASDAAERVAKIAPEEAVEKLTRLLARTRSANSESRGPAGGETAGPPARDAGEAIYRVPVDSVTFCRPEAPPNGTGGRPLAAPRVRPDGGTERGFGEQPQQGTERQSAGRGISRSTGYG